MNFPYVCPQCGAKAKCIEDADLNAKTCRNVDGCSTEYEIEKLADDIAAADQQGEQT